MKRKTLTTAVLAGITGVAGIANISNAVNLNPDGLGQVLVYPFYTVNAENDTLLSVVNTTDTVKAVKVRFLESKNSREVLDFNLYMSPFDVWTAALTRDPASPDEGFMVLTTNDTSCTVPAIDGVGNREGTFDDGRPFVRATNLLFTEFSGVDNSQARTREGYFEIIEMGIVDEDVDPTVTTFEASAIHTSAGVPLDCSVLVAAWTPPSGAWVADRNLDIAPPEGGLFGGASVINVLEGTQVSYDPDAIDAFYTPADGVSTLHFEPGDILPNFTQAETGSIVSVDSLVFDNGRIVSSQWTNGEDAVTAVFMRNQIYNEYAIEAELNGETEWVVTFPTKRFYVDPAIVGGLDDVNVRPPFTQVFNDDDIPTGGACEPVGLNFWDREEQTTIITGDVFFSPFQPDSPLVPTLCFEAQVVTFGQRENLDQDGDGQTDSPSLIFGSLNAQNIPVEDQEFESGWALIDFTSNVDADEHEYASVEGDVYEGLPATGFAAQIVQNGTLEGGTVLANYGGLFEHKSARSICDQPTQVCSLGN